MPNAAEPGTNRQVTGKARVDLVPLEFVEGLAAVFEMGAKKYAPWAWARNVMPRWVMYASLIRHVAKSRREKLDEESGLDHRLHAAWNLLVDWYYDEYGYEREVTVDDRPSVPRSG